MSTFATYLVVLLLCLLFWSTVAIWLWRILA